MEVYDHSRFAIFTGEVLEPERPISDSQAALDWLVENAFAAKAKRGWTIAASEFNQETLVGSDDEILGHALARDKKFRRLFSGDSSGYPSQSEADLALCAKISF